MGTPVVQPAHTSCAPDLADEVLLLCILADRDAAQQARLCSLVANVRLDWERFWRQAVAQQIVPLVASVLTGSLTAPHLPKRVFDDARWARAQTTAHNLAIHSEFQRIGATLHAAGIPAAPLKGTFLAERLYSNIGDRETKDLDVLVPNESLGAARAALESIGYRSAADLVQEDGEHRFHISLFRAGPGIGYLVELHQMLSDPRTVNIDHTQLWERILTHSGTEERFRPLPADDLLLYLAQHLFRHDFALRRLIDVDRLIRSYNSALDWPVIVERSKSWTVAPALYFALRFSQRLLVTPVPQEVLQRLQPALWRRALVLSLARPGALLRAMSGEQYRYAWSRLIYCATLSPWPRMLDGYITFMCARPKRRRGGVWGAVLDSFQRLGGGMARTGLALWGSSSLGSSWQAKFNRLPLG